MPAFRALMDYAIIKLGNKQHRVRDGETLVVDRLPTEEGKTSSVHFLHFPFSAEAKAAFKKAGTEVIIGCNHAKYGHMAVMPEEMRDSLARDFE